MPFLRRAGVSLYYEVHGSGAPILLSHGYSSTSAMWTGQINALTSAGYRLIIWDMRGHGRTSYPEDQDQYSEAHTVADMSAIIEHLCGHDEKVIVGGLSLGGYMSLALYRSHAARVKTLMIIDTGPGFRSDQARERWNKYALRTATDLTEAGLSVLQHQSPERQRVQHRSADGLIRAARGMLTQWSSAVIDSLPNINVPTLLVIGADDTPFIAGTEYMHKKIAGSKKLVIPNAGHAANIDQPAKFNQGLLSFLKEVDTKARL